MKKENSISSLYHRTHKKLLTYIRELADPYNFNQGELSLLVRLIKKGDGISQKELRNKLPISKSTLSKTVNNLVDKDYLRKETDPDDKRVTLIYLTQQGKEMEETLAKINRQAEDKMLQGFKDKEIENLSEYMERMLDNLSNGKTS